jgi:Fe-S oxidoreductase
MAANDLQDALSLCLGCKACKSECPAGVDMTRLKSEVLYQVHGGEAKSFKRYLYRHYAKVLPWLNRLRTIVPWLNLLAELRKLPVADGGDLKAWWHQTGEGINPTDGQLVVVWVDVFTRWLHPLQGQAAIKVLQRLGYRVYPVWLSDSPRLLISQGFLAQAKSCLLNALSQLPKAAVWGLVGIEPSELLVLRDDGLALLPFNQQQALTVLSRRIWLFEEAILAFASEYPDHHWASIAQPVTVHVHCHQKSLVGVESAKRALALLGVSANIVDAGCCGMGGSFGYENPDLSVKIAQQGIIPAVHVMPEGAILVTSGSSCQQQISDLTAKKGIHIAQVFAQSLGGK